MQPLHSLGDIPNTPRQSQERRDHIDMHLKSTWVKSTGTSALFSTIWVSACRQRGGFYSLVGRRAVIWLWIEYFQQHSRRIASKPPPNVIRLLNQYKRIVCRTTRATTWMTSPSSALKYTRASFSDGKKEKMENTHVPDIRLPVAYMLCDICQPTSRCQS